MARQRCPNCDSFGVLPIHRRPWRKMLGLRNYLRCIDCGHRFIGPRP